MLSVPVLAVTECPSRLRTPSKQQQANGIGSVCQRRQYRVSTRFVIECVYPGRMCAIVVKACRRIVSLLDLMVDDLTGGGVQTSLRKQSRATVTSMPLSCIVILLASLVLSDVQKIGTRDDNKRFLHFFPGRPQENNFSDGNF